MWDVIDGWLTALPADTFTQVLPLLRRTFSTFEPPERRQMGERARRGRAKAGSHPAAAGAAGAPGDLDEARAAAVLPLLCQILGLERPR